MIKHWINGKEVASEETFDNFNPATGDVICQVASGGEKKLMRQFKQQKTRSQNGQKHQPKNAPV